MYIYIDFENVDIITQEKSYWRRLIREGLEIKQLGNENRANLQAGYEINECWDPILKKKTWTPCTGVPRENSFVLFETENSNIQIIFETETAKLKRLMCVAVNLIFI